MKVSSFVTPCTTAPRYVLVHRSASESAASSSVPRTREAVSPLVRHRLQFGEYGDGLRREGDGVLAFGLGDCVSPLCGIEVDVRPLCVPYSPGRTKTKGASRRAQRTTRVPS